MSATGASEEIPFIAGMERVPPKSDWQEVTVSTGRNLWSIHGMAHRIMETLGLVQSKAQSLADRGPDPDYEDAEAIASRGAPRVAISGDGQYRPKSDWPRRRNAIIDGLLIAGIIALVSTSIYLLKTTVQLETSYTERGALYDYRFRNIESTNERQDTEFRRHDERLNRLEQQRRDAQRNANDQ